MYDSTTTALLNFRHNGITESIKSTGGSVPYSPIYPDRFPNRKPRKAISHFSNSAKNTLKKNFESIDWEPYLSPSDHAKSARGLFVTLVCDQDTQHDLYSFKRLKDALNLAIKRQFDDYEGLFYKCELQPQTGTPHLHLTIFFKAAQDRLRVHRRFRDVWSRLNGNDSPAFCRYAVKTQSIYGPKVPLRLRNYLLTQPVTEDQIWDLGKVSGTWGKLPIEKGRTFDLNDFYVSAAMEIAFLSHPNTAKRAQDLFSRPLVRKTRGFRCDLDPNTRQELEDHFHRLRVLPFDQLYDLREEARDAASQLANS